MKRISVCIFALSLGFSLRSQTPVGSPPPSGPGSFIAQAAQAWYRGGNVSTTSPAGFNIFGFNNSNSPEIWFQTGGFNRILLGNAGIPVSGGKIVFGNNITSGFALLDRLQSHITIAGDNMFRFTNPNTGPSEGYRHGLLDSANVVLFQHHHRSAYQFEIRDQANTPNRHLTKFTITNINQTNNALNFNPTYIDVPRVGIWDGASFVANQELAMLHIGRPNNSLTSINWGTHRDWMNIGTFYNQGSDAMYVGLHEHSVDQTDAVIVWGDNPIQTGNAADRLKFIFTVDQGALPASNASAYNGLEVARMTSDAKDGAAIFNDRLNLDPQNSVHIIGQTANGNSSTPGGNSGLRLHFVQSTTPPLATNPGPGVLSVNNNGDVVYVPGTSANNGLSINSGNVQLGGDCSVAAQVTAAGLLSSRKVLLNNKNLFFADATGVNGRVGIGDFATCVSPGNLVEIRTSTGPSASGLSGLRLTDLQTGATPAAPNGNVLSVNSNGDVILVPDQVGTGGSGFTTAQNGLTAVGTNIVELGGTLLHNTQVNMASKDMVFATSFGNFMVGSGNSGPAGSNNIFNGNSNSITGPSTNDFIYGDLNQVNNTGGSNSENFIYGVGNDIQDGAGGNFAYGYNNSILASVSGNGSNRAHVFGNANVSGGFTSIVMGNGSSAPSGYVAIGNSSAGKVAANDWLSSGFNPLTVSNPAYVPALNIDPSNEVGVKCLPVPGTAITANGIVIPFLDNAFSLGTSSFRWSEVWAAQGAIQTSDKRTKENVKDLAYGLKEIMQLKPISYTFIKNPEYGTKIGFIAQDLQKIIPEVVREGKDENKILGVNYAEITALLVKGMQEQQKQIDELKSIVQSLASNTGSGSAGSRSINGQSINLSDKNVIVLDQNVPNPFAESTVITYNIPVDFTKAQISFSTSDGKIIKIVDIMTNGEGRLAVFANDLTNGFYTYTLIVDGKVIDTKKMVKD